MSRVLEMRTAFDRSFAEPARTEQEPLQDFLAVQVGADPYAVRLADLTGLFADRPITRLASADPAFLGIAGVRGAVVPVYDLGAFLGYPPGEARRWLLLIGGGGLALAFESFEGYLRLPPTALVAQVAQKRSQVFVGESLHAPGSVRAVVQVAAIYQAIEQGAQRRGHQEES
jgi:chemotaxis signal transduction protein